MRARPFLISALLAAACGPTPALAESQHLAVQPLPAALGTVARNLPWFADNGRAAAALIDLLESAPADGLDSSAYQTAELRAQVANGLHGSLADRRKAGERLTAIFIRYAADVARARESATFYVDSAARPRPVSVARLVSVAASASAFDQFIGSMGWMHPYYAALRAELRSAMGSQQEPARIEWLKLNLERARVLPRGPAPAIIVNTATARLDYFENRKVRDSMRVVVGKVAQQTPMMAGLIRYAILNPYWHVPPDLARTLIAPRVLKEGLGYLRERGYQLVSDWSDDARTISPKSVDWKAVASGKTEVIVRQLPGPGNGMGEVKFMFPNNLGIYLHDTPSKDLFAKDDRQFSAGCVRLEDANGLKRLLLGGTGPAASGKPEQVIALSHPVPVYLTYLTMFPENGHIVERGDVYARDRLAANVTPTVQSINK